MLTRHASSRTAAAPLRIVLACVATGWLAFAGLYFNQDGGLLLPGRHRGRAYSEEAAL